MGQYIVHGYDVAQVFYQAVTHRKQALGESFDAEAAEHVMLYGYAKHLYGYFGHEPKIKSYCPAKYGCLKTIDLAVKSYLDRRLITIRRP